MTYQVFAICQLKWAWLRKMFALADFLFQEMANSKLKLRKIKHLEPSTSCNILWSYHLLTRYLTLLTLCREQVTYLKGYFWSWKPISNRQLMSLLPLEEQVLGLGIREAGLMVPQQILRDKLAVVPWVQGGVEKERIVLWAESGTRKDTVKHTLEEAEESTLHHAFSLLLFLCSEVLCILNWHGLSDTQERL